MDPNPYTKRELDHYFEDMRSDIKEILTDGKQTKEQAFKTNGRVTRIEWQIKAFWWALGALWTILMLTFPSFIRFINKVDSLGLTVTSLIEAQ